MSIFRMCQRMPDVRIETVRCNSAPAMVIYSGDHREGVFLIELIEGKITHFSAIRNPDKLAAMAVPRRISR